MRNYARRQCAAPATEPARQTREPIMSQDREHPYIPELQRQLADRKIDRREFLRIATLLGVSAPTPTAWPGCLAPARRRAHRRRAASCASRMRVQDLKSPHTYSWIEGANWRARSSTTSPSPAIDNVTRPTLVEKWEASPDLKTWTLHLRRDVKWRNGRQFTADDVVWNLKRVLDPKTGSSTSAS